MHPGYGNSLAVVGTEELSTTWFALSTFGYKQAALLQSRYYPHEASVVYAGEDVQDVVAALASLSTIAAVKTATPEVRRLYKRSIFNRIPLRLEATRAVHMLDGYVHHPAFVAEHLADTTCHALEGAGFLCFEPA